MKSFLRKWLGINHLEFRVGLSNMVRSDITKAEVEAMLAKHFTQVEEYVSTKVERPKLDEKKVPTTRVRNFSQFRDRVEASVYSEK